MDKSQETLHVLIPWFYAPNPSMLTLSIRADMAATFSLNFPSRRTRMDRLSRFKGDSLVRI